MEFIKKNLTVILLSVMCTLLLVVTILLIVDKNTFKFSNVTSKDDSLQKNTKVIKKEEKTEDVSESESKSEIIKEEVKEKIESIKEEIKSENIIPSIKESKEEEKSEENLLSYFNSQTQLFTNKSESTSKLKDAFTSIIDFIFYDKEIKGYKFKELTNMVKLEIINSALTIDKEIDTYFPDYKETIKDKYASVKGTLALKYLEITSSFCSNSPKLCEQAKLNFNTMKSNYEFALELAKELVKSGSSKIKDLYEKWKDE